MGMIERFLEAQLTRWLCKKPRKPLVLRGARQVGKSTLVRQWAAGQGLHLAEVNLERHPQLDRIFQTNDVEKILRELEVVTKVAITTPNIALFLDEIQATPHALPALRYLYEDKPGLPVLAAGSLLEFILSDHQLSMPVGRVEYLHVGPLTFMEFLGALGEDRLQKILRNFHAGATIPAMAHERLLEKQREFLFVGGMPESVQVYQQTRSPLEVRTVHRSIVQTYQDDFAKYGKREKVHVLLHTIIDVMPKLVGRKIKYSAISSDHRSGEVKAAIDLLIKARLVLPCYHTDCSGLPLKAGRDDHIYKLYFLDVGLFNYVCGLEWAEITRLTERELIHEGGLAEQFVAQHLAYRIDGAEPPALFYWLRESRAANAEVDFVVAMQRTIVPIEVKSGKSGSLKSLQQLMGQKRLTKALRFDLNPPSQHNVTHKLTGPVDGEENVSFTLTSWPLYLVERLYQWK